ncbi:SRPBCC domain-containing protein [Brachybacterium sp. YJGR34]|uniref:SRPBCC domain-containing protein n=1 Tax=Brachybacterium sp. YJGR34 TaxID=2059911 RepID=UPI000E0B1FEB|nr:SRPBCC domain-containing protein [Brachybacterium sp. YJGR34]
MSASPTSQLSDVTRTVSPARPGNAVVLSQIFPVPAAELWAALTTADRLARWFGRASGELAEGGRYELPDMETTGTVTALEDARRLQLTWESAGSRSVMELLLEPAEETGATRLTLRHEVPADAHWAAFGPAATGCGWDAALYGLALHLEDPSADVLAQLGPFAISPEGAEFTRATADAWCTAHVASGADRKPARKASVRTAAFYLGEEPDLS